MIVILMLYRDKSYIECLFLGVFMKDNPFLNLKLTRGEVKSLMAVLDTYQGEKPQSCKWIIKVLKQQLEVNGINPTKLNRN